MLKIPNLRPPPPRLLLIPPLLLLIHHHRSQPQLHLPPLLRRDVAHPPRHPRVHRVPHAAQELQPHHRAPDVSPRAGGTLGALEGRLVAGGGEGRDGAGAGGEVDDAGGEVAEREEGGEPEGQLGGVGAREDVQVQTGDGVEEGEARDDEGLDDLAAVGM